MFLRRLLWLERLTEPLELDAERLERWPFLVFFLGVRPRVLGEEASVEAWVTGTPEQRI